MRLFIIFFLLWSQLPGVELELDTVYEGPKKLTVSSLGVNMGLPARWKAIAKKGEGLLLYQEDSNNTITLRAKEMGAQAALNYLSTTHYLKGRIKIFPEGKINRLSSYIFYRAYVAGGVHQEKSVLIYMVIGPQNRAIRMHTVYQKKDETKIKATCMNIIQALSFTPTKQLKSAEVDLEKRLRGAHIAYMNRDGGYSSKRELWLCSNHRYQLKGARTVQGGMSREYDLKYGHWSVENDDLVLKGDDGRELLIKVERRDRALFFDGQRSYELTNHQCR